MSAVNKVGLFAALALVTSVQARAGVVRGLLDERRPYELVRANRRADFTPPVADVTDPSLWTLETESAHAAFTRADERLLFGEGLGRLEWTARGTNPVVRLRLKRPVRLAEDFDFASVWVYGDMIKSKPVAERPAVTLRFEFTSPDGRPFELVSRPVEHLEWFKVMTRVDESCERKGYARAGATFLGFRVDGGAASRSRRLEFDALSVFRHSTRPLTFRSRARRPHQLFADMPKGINTGDGVLPFPDRDTTVLPPPVPEVAAKLEWRWPRDPGVWDDLAFRYAGGDWCACAVGGGIWFAAGRGHAAPFRAAKSAFTSTPMPDGGVVCRGGFADADGTSLGTGEIRFRPVGHVLSVEVAVQGGRVGEVRFGDWREAARKVQIPFLTYRGYGRVSRPYARLGRSGTQDLFLLALADWCNSNASGIREQGVHYGERTDHCRNACYERLTYAVSPDLTDVFPTIPNPVSPWKSVTGTHVWLTACPWGPDAAARDRLLAKFRDRKRRGLTELVVTGHEGMWRDGEESYTFRTEMAPKKGGDAAERAYARALIDELGYFYGPYNNFIDLPPVNSHYDPDRVALVWGGRPDTGWVRCFRAKPLFGVEMSEILPFDIQRKFGYTCGYCDLITAMNPWQSGDEDVRCPGAATGGQCFYTRGETLLLQKRAWKGPVYSEGGCHAYWCGLADGSYGQDPGAGLDAGSPWLVDFQLRRLSPLCCDFGMGSPQMFWHDVPATRIGADVYRDRFLAATVAFGHSGFLFGKTVEDEDLSYFMIQALAARYTQSAAAKIGYADADGVLHGVSEAVRSGVLLRSQVVTEYADGTVTAVNGSTNETMRAAGFELPPNGYAGRTRDGTVDVFSGLVDGHRVDRAKAPRYVLLNGRGTWTRFPEGATDGLVVRLLRQDGEDVFLHSATAVELPFAARFVMRLDGGGRELGAAEFAIDGGRTRIRAQDARSYSVKR